MKRILPIAILFLLGCVSLKAQQAPIQVDPAVAAQHLLSHPQVEYPAIARAARVGGTVLMLATIGESGKITDLAVISGPPMLQFAALQAVRQFTFNPFLQNGKPVPVTTFIGIDFVLNVHGDVIPTGSASVLETLKVDDGMRRRANFLTSYRACDHQVEQRTETSQAVKLCLDATQKAEMVPSGASARRAAYVAYATALLQDGKPTAAIEPGNRAIAAANTVSNDASGTSSAYAVTGEALALSGNLQQANNDFSTAEKYAHKAMNEMPSHSSMREQRSQTLKALLEYHAKILEKMGNEKDAQKKLKEAAML